MNNLSLIAIGIAIPVVIFVLWKIYSEISSLDEAINRLSDRLIALDTSIKVQNSIQQAPLTATVDLSGLKDEFTALRGVIRSLSEVISQPVEPEMEYVKVRDDAQAHDLYDKVYRELITSGIDPEEAKLKAGDWANGRVMAGITEGDFS